MNSALLCVAHPFIFANLAPIGIRRFASSGVSCVSWLHMSNCVMHFVLNTHTLHAILCWFGTRQIKCPACRRWTRQYHCDRLNFGLNSLTHFRHSLRDHISNRCCVDMHVDIEPEVQFSSPIRQVVIMMVHGRARSEQLPTNKSEPQVFAPK